MQKQKILNFEIHYINNNLEDSRKKHENAVKMN